MSLLGMKFLAMAPKAAVPAFSHALLNVNFEDIMKSADSADTSAVDELVGKTESIGWGIQKVIATVILIAVIIAGMVFAGSVFFMSPQQRQDAKATILWKIGSVVAIAAIPALVMLLLTLGGQLFN